MNDNEKNISYAAGEPDLEQLRRSWRRATSATSADTASARCLRDMEHRALTERIATPAYRLERIAFRPILFIIIGVAISLLFRRSDPVIMAAMDLFFIVMAVIHLRIYRMVRQLQPSAMTVSEMLATLCRIEIARSRARITGMALALPLVAWMMYVFAAEYGEYALYGSCVGLVAGLTAGICIWRKGARLIRQMKKQLEP